MSATEIIKRFIKREAKPEPTGEEPSGIFEGLEKIGHDRQGIVNVDSRPPVPPPSLPDLASR